MTWLTSLTKGAMAVNYEYLFQLGYGTREEIAACDDAYPCDPDAGDFPIIVRPGMWLRLTRNLDKDRGFCNGALGLVRELLRVGPGGPVFTMQLTHGCMVLVHPISDEQGRRFLPCIYGYAMTTRKAQGSTISYAVLYFDLWMPAPRGQAYVEASRVRAHDRLYYFGSVRRSDWLPVGGPGAPMEQVDRGVPSEDSDPDLDYERSESDSSAMSSQGDSFDDADAMVLFGDREDAISDGSADSEEAMLFAGEGETGHVADLEILLDA